MDSVTHAGHHGQTTSGQWWVGEGLHQETAGRAATMLPQHSRRLGLPLKALCCYSAAELSHGCNRVPPWGKNYFHSFPKQCL